MEFFKGFVIFFSGDWTALPFDSILFHVQLLPTPFFNIALTVGWISKFFHSLFFSDRLFFRCVESKHDLSTYGIKLLSVKYVKRTYQMESIYCRLEIFPSLFEVKSTIPPVILSVRQTTETETDSTLWHTEVKLFYAKLCAVRLYK